MSCVCMWEGGCACVYVCAYVKGYCILSYRLLGGS